MIRHLLWFQKRAPWKQGIPLHPPTPSQDLFSDASLTGWGAQLGESSVSEEWDSPWVCKHINILEMRAVILACQAFQDRLKGVVTRLHIDNSTVVAHLRKEGGTKAHKLVELMRSFLTWCDARRIQVQAVHIAGVRNVVADSLSRQGQLQASEWALSGQEFVRISGFWRRPEVDLMATASNRRCCEFISPVPHHEPSSRRGQ